MKKLRVLFLIFFLLFDVVFAKAIDEEAEKDKFAAFVPLIAFGENILEKGQIAPVIFSDYFIGKSNYIIDILPGIIYGITDDFSIFLSLPFAPRNKMRSDHSAGVEDLLIQFEYAFFNKESSYALDRATIVAAFLYPTGSVVKQPPTGFGSNSYFLGMTLSRATTNWFFFTSHGALLTTTKNDIKIGERFLYQGGVGRNIAKTGDWVFAMMAEIDGFYLWKNKVEGANDPDSGGNLLYITPSIWIARKKVVVQFGAGYPIIQNLNGNQPKQYTLIGLNIGIIL